MSTPELPKPPALPAQSGMQVAVGEDMNSVVLVFPEAKFNVSLSSMQALDLAAALLDKARVVMRLDG